MIATHSNAFRYSEPCRVAIRCLMLALKEGLQLPFTHQLWDIIYKTRFTESKCPKDIVFNSENMLTVDHACLLCIDLSNCMYDPFRVHVLLLIGFFSICGNFPCNVDLRLANLTSGCWFMFRRIVVVHFQGIVLNSHGHT